MNKKGQLKHQWLWPLISIIGLGMSPLLVTACSDNSSTTIAAPITYRDKLAAKLQNFQFDADSTNIQVKGVPPTIDPVAKSYKYLTGNFTTLDEVKRADATDWKTSLPQTINYIHNNRNFWVKVELKSVSELAATPDLPNDVADEFANDYQYFNITESSKIRTIKSAIDGDKNFSSLSLAGISIGGTLESPLLNNANFTLPSNTEIRYLVADNWVNGAELINYIKNNRQAPTITAQIASIRAKLITTEPSRYTINNDKEVTLSSNFTIQATIENYKVILKNLRPNPSSNHSYIYWDTPANFATIKPADLTVHYYLGPESNVNALGAVAWRNNLPNEANYNHSLRHFYAKLTTTQNATPTIIDLTVSSKIDKVKTSIDYASNFGSVSLATITLRGPLSSANLDTSRVNLPVGATLKYLVSGSWMNVDSFLSYLKNNASALTSDDTSAMRLRLEVIDPALYVIYNAKETVLQYSAN